MFIEWISTTAKREYMEDYVRKINRGRTGLEKMMPARTIEHAECFRVEGFEEYIKELEYHNIFVRFYSALVTLNKKQVRVNDCLVFSFGDFSCDVYKCTLTGALMDEPPHKFYEFLRQYECDFFAKDKNFDPEYAKKFIRPNIIPQQKKEFEKKLSQKQRISLETLTKKQQSQVEKVYNLKNTKQTKLFDEKDL